MSSLNRRNVVPKTSRPRVELEVGHADLMLVGDNALVRDNTPPSVLQYHGPIYQHGVETLRGSPEPLYSPPPTLPHKQTAGFMTYGGGDGDSLGSVLPETTGKGGLFQPRSRPTSATNLYGSRPGSVAERSVTNHSRPPSGRVSRPPSGFGMDGRPQSVAGIDGRPPSVAGIDGRYSRHHSRILTNTPDSDPDHEPISDVLSRLGEYTQNFAPEIPLAYVDCECTTPEQQTSSRLAKLYDSDKDSSSSEEEEVGVSVDVLLKTFQQYEDRGHTAHRHKAMLTLVTSYVSEESLSDQHFKTILVFMKSNVPQVQDACLTMLKQCVKNRDNLTKLLDAAILDSLYQYLVQSELPALKRPALLLLEAVFSHHQHKQLWLKDIMIRFLPKLLSMVRGSQVGLEVKYAACCVFRALAHMEELIANVTDDILPAVILMRNASAKFKEVYVEILTVLLSHTDCIPPDLVDSSAIPITVSIIREGPCGPQCAALHLLASLTTSDPGVAMVIGTHSLVPMILCCMKESHCRKVRLNATEVMKNLCTSRKLGLCKDLMLQLSSYLVPSIEHDSLTSLSQMAAPDRTVPIRPRFDEERQMWQGLEKFIDMVKGVVFREGKVETDELGLVSKVHMKPCIDVCPVQLTLLAHAFTMLQSVCLWPLDKSRLGFSANRVELTSFTTDDKQRARLSKVNRGLTQSVWDRVGVVVTDLLSAYADKFSKTGQNPAEKGKQLQQLDCVFEAEEIHLIMSMLQLLLCSSLCTCVAFPEIIPKLDDKKSKKGQKSPNKLKSFSSSQISPENKSSPVESKLRSQSDVGKSFTGDEERLWVKDNPHLTHAHAGHDATLERSRAELQHKEACTDRRLLRKCLYETAVFRCVCPFLHCSEDHVKVLALQILRCLIQPLEERVAPKLSYTTSGHSSKLGRQRPQTAGATQQANRKLNMALYRMSPDLAGLIKDALGPSRVDEAGGDNNKVGEDQGSSGEDRGRVKTAVLNIPVPGSSEGLETIQERLQDYTEMSKEEETSRKPAPEPVRQKPVIDRCRPIAQQCREALLEGVGEGLVQGIFSQSPQSRRHYVLLMHDLVQHGQVETHMLLSSQGCIPRLIDFLRVNEDNELLEIMGLIIVRMLVSSDPRLKQLFSRHGGPQLLLSMAQYTKGLLKQEVSSTLKSVSKVDSPLKKRPQSAPVIRMANKDRPPDIWDHIQSRWKQEDQVKQVLRQWIQTDTKAHGSR